MDRQAARAEASRLAKRYRFHCTETKGGYSVGAEGFPAENGHGATKAQAYDSALYLVTRALEEMLLKGKEIPATTS